MTLRLDDALRRQIEALEPELLAAAQAMGLGALAKLAELRPGLTTTDGSGPPSLEGLSLSAGDAVDPGDAVQAAAVLAAHQAYVRRRGTPDGLSLGALSLARIIVWMQRASMLAGAAPQVVWMGPEARIPDGLNGTRVVATARVVHDGRRRTARAVAVIQPPPSRQTP